MDIYVPLRRGTLLIPSGPVHDQDRKHLFVILTDSTLDSADGVQKMLLTSISTVHSRSPDITCLLRPGDHPFIQQESFVDYAFTRIVEVNLIIQHVQEGVFVPREPMPPAVFTRICQGLQNSRRIAPRMVEFYWESGATP